MVKEQRKIKIFKNKSLTKLELEINNFGEKYNIIDVSLSTISQEMSNVEYVCIVLYQGENKKEI